MSDTPNNTTEQPCHEHERYSEFVYSSEGQVMIQGLIKAIDDVWLEAKRDAERKKESVYREWNPKIEQAFKKWLEANSNA